MASVWEAAVGGAVCQEKAVAAPACSAEALSVLGGGSRRAPRPAWASPLPQLKPETGQRPQPVLCLHPPPRPHPPNPPTSHRCVLQGPRSVHLESFAGTARPSVGAALLAFASVWGSERSSRVNRSVLGQVGPVWTICWVGRAVSDLVLPPG